MSFPARPPHPGPHRPTPSMASPTEGRSGAGQARWRQKLDEMTAASRVVQFLRELTSINLPAGLERPGPASHSSSSNTDEPSRSRSCPKLSSLLDQVPSTPLGLGNLGLGSWGSGARLPAFFQAGSRTAATASPASMAAGSSRDAAVRGSAARDTGDSGGGADGPSHLVVMVNGLFGGPGNWTVLCEHLRGALGDTRSAVLLHPSAVNRRLQSYHGIDVCGSRLAAEIRTIVDTHPSLDRISIIGHSMGGLIARYAMGLLYNPERATVAGLTPCHFISIATPHLGCGTQGEAQVPLIGWLLTSPALAVSPWLLGGLQQLLASFSAPISAALFKRTGAQFFLADDGSHLAQVALPGRKLPPPAAPAAPAAAAAAAAGAVSGSGAAAADAAGGLSIAAAAVAAAAALQQLLQGVGLVAGSNAAAAAAASGSQQPPHGSADAVALADATALADAADAKGGGSSSAAAEISSAASQPLQPRTIEPSDPLLYQLAYDYPDKGRYFFSALSAFASRTAYANTSGDHLVGWANSSLRYLHELPELPQWARKAKGVVLEDPLHAAFTLHRPAALGGGQSGDSGDGSGECTAVQADGQPGVLWEECDDVLGAGPEQPLGLADIPIEIDPTVAAAAERRQRERLQSVADAADAGRVAASSPASPLAAPISQPATAAAGGGISSEGVQAAQAAAAELEAEAEVERRAKYVNSVLQQLQSLPWRRVDVSFQGAAMPMAHSNIQVTRRWLNFEGKAVASHIAAQLVALEQQLLDTVGGSTQAPVLAPAGPDAVAAASPVQQLGANKREVSAVVAGADSSDLLMG